MTDETSELRRAMAGVRALVLDADGVLVFRGVPIPGSPEALETLAARGVPFRIVTNYSVAHRATLVARFAAEWAVTLRPEQLITAASAAAAYTARRHPGAALLVLASPDARREWDGQQLVSPDVADTDSSGVAAVVIGDAGDDLSFRNLDVAFRQLRAGAEFVAMHRNPWWLTRRGPTLDAGAIVAGLEFALGRRAVVCGKPSPVVFRQAVAELRAELVADGTAGSRLTARAVAMVGDDLEADVFAARRAGLRGIFVLSGKQGREDLERASGGRRGTGRPDAVAASLAEVVAALDVD